MSETWSWLVTVAAWVFLLGTLLVAASVVPALRRRRPRLLLDGFALAISSLGLVFLAWALPRLF